MSAGRRPWWLLIYKPEGLVTTIEDQSRPGERVFVIRGEPMVRALAWLTCGPVAALLAIAALTVLAVAINSQAQPGLVRLLLVGAFLALPALAWVAAIVVANRISGQYVRAIKEAETQECVIRLNQKDGTFSCKPARGEWFELRYEQILRARVVPALGAQNSAAVNLILETSDGPLVLLNDRVGNHAQKADVAQEIEIALQKFAANKNPSG